MRRGNLSKEWTVRLLNLERGREVTIKRDKNGKFYRRGLQAVAYEMFVEKDGYQPIKDKITLVAGADRRFDFELAKASPLGADEFQRGVTAYNKSDFAAAANAFEAAINKAPTIPDLHVNPALAYFRLDRKEEAVAHLEKAASLGPDDPKIHFHLGGADVEMQSYDKAIAAFEKGLSKPVNLTRSMRRRRSARFTLPRATTTRPLRSSRRSSQSSRGRQAPC